VPNVIWLSWRQFRAQAAVAAAALAVFAILLAVTGPHLASLYAARGIARCYGVGCGPLASSFLTLVGGGIYPVVYVLGLTGIVVAPGVIGIFWGAPLVAREFETGTFRLAWTQSITRARWLAGKLALPGLAAMAVTEGLSLMLAWWAAPIGQAARLTGQSTFPLGMGPFSPLVFDAHGVVPLGYAAFGFTLGLTVGLLLRRAVLAMAVTLVLFAAVQIAMPLGIRPNLFSPQHATLAVGSFNGPTFIGASTFAFNVDYLPSQPGAWIISSGAVNAAGQPVSVIPAACRQGAANGTSDFPGCMASRGIRIAVTYQPTSRYWTIQWTETVIYLALALTLAGFCFWRVGRRAS
jgi:ABC-2 family transporter protein